MAVVSISRQYGAGGQVIGEMVAQRLGYRLVNRTILTEVAKKAGVSVYSVEDAEKEAGDLLSRLVAEVIKASPYVRNLPDYSATFDEEDYRSFLRRVISEMAAQGSLVIIGRGSQFVLQNHPTTVRVMLVAREEDRIKRLMSHYKLDRDRAEQVARREEKKRIAFLKAFDSHDPDDPALYHLVLNTSLVSLELAADLIAQLARAQG
ncbi:MAG: cytidylate kinase-like family protein [Desulfarculus sp.]|nr:cytidylate kinase-like family protein [Desulfarculus sp.]